MNSLNNVSQCSPFLLELPTINNDNINALDELKEENVMYHVSSCSTFNTDDNEFVLHNCYTINYTVNKVSCACDTLGIFASVKSEIVFSSSLTEFRPSMYVSVFIC